MSQNGPQIFSALIRNAAAAADHNLDYADGNAETMHIAPSAGQVLVINRMIVSYSDTGSMDAAKYGNNIDLTNGITMGVDRSTDSKELFDLIDPLGPILTNGDWMTYCYDQALQVYGIGDEYLAMRWTFGKSGKSIWLHGDEGHRIWLNLDDDFSDLNTHRFLFQGYYHSGGPGWTAP